MGWREKEPGMKTYLLILPVALLVVYSQLVMKWRAGVVMPPADVGLWRQLLTYLSDPLIVSAYIAALLGSFAWLYVVTKLSLTVAFPVYIGITFAFVMLGGWYFLAESMPPVKMFAVLLIFAGIVLGVTAND
jgi:multidrug transporter EmrE-like cation transporter